MVGSTTCPGQVWPEHGLLTRCEDQPGGTSSSTASMVQ